MIQGPNSSRRGPEYVDGRYIPERRRNPLIKTPLGGRILSASQLPAFKLLPPKGFGVLTTTGRKTGKKRSRCVRAIRRGDKAYLAAIGGERSAWVKNIRANPEVRLRIRGGTFTGRARELQEASERKQALEAYCGTFNGFDFLEYRVHRNGRPTRAGIEELHRTWFEGGIPMVVELRGES